MASPKVQTKGEDFKNFAQFQLNCLDYEIAQHQIRSFSADIF